MRKKIIGLIVMAAILTATLSAVSCGLAGSAKPSGQIIMGSVTALEGSFMTGWTNGGTDADIKGLIHGYETVAFTEKEVFEVDQTVVKKLTPTENADGSKTFEWQLNKNLIWNDDTKITAKDYVFAILLTSSQQFEELEASAVGGYDFVGYDEFYEGTSKEFKGVRLIDDYIFSVTLKADELPNYYELAYTTVMPYPMHILAPGVTISDDGNGAYFSDNFTTELIMETINKEGTGYRFKPTVTCGPYNFEEYDMENNTASVVVNEKFVGFYDGKKPLIERIIIKLVSNDTMMDELDKGYVDVLPGINGGTRIEKGQELADTGRFNSASYARAGYGKIAFHCDAGPTQFKEVRQAIAYCLDREEFARQWTGGYGIVVNGPYGASMWEYKDSKAELDEKLNNYTFNIEKAKELLIEGGWTLNEKGEAFVEGTDKIRYKNVNGGLMPLIIEWASVEDNPVAALIKIMLPGEVEKNGMKINQTEMDWGTLQANNAKSGEFNMFNLATGFSPVYAQWEYYSTDPAFLGNNYNNNFIIDEQLSNLANDMKKTKPGNNDEWRQKFVAFQIRWNELMPDIPLYSDEYYEFYTTSLENYNPSPLWSFRYAILRASMK